MLLNIYDENKEFNNLKTSNKSINSLKDEKNNINADSINISDNYLTENSYDIIEDFNL